MIRKRKVVLLCAVSALALATSAHWRESFTPLMTAETERIALAIWQAPAAFMRPEAPGVAYDTAEVTRGSIRKIVSTSGPVRPLITVQISSQLSGQIQELNADFNSEVKAGDVVAKLDPKTFASKVAQAAADLAMAKASLKNQEAALEKAEAVRRQAERAIDRQEELIAKRVSAQAQADIAARDAEVARADIAVALAEIERNKANVAQREAALAQARIDLDRTQIRSPIDGVVISRTVDVGQTVAASFQAPELFRIAQDLRRIHIEAQVNEADVGQVSAGNPVAFTLDAYPDLTFRGKVSQVRFAAQELHNVVTYTVVVAADNSELKLLPGMTANVQIETASRDSVLRIPAEALRFKPRNENAVAKKTDRAERNERRLDALKERLKLTDEQMEAARAGLAKIEADRAATKKRKGNSSDSEDGQAPSDGQRERTADRLARVLMPLLDDKQRALFEKWKERRDNTRPARIWVLDSSGEPELRPVRVGLADDKFAELASGAVKEGERVVIRAREAAKK
jgi:HlyD family secretion protein